MAPKITTGSGLRGSLEYDLASKNGEPPGEWVAGTLHGSAREMSKQAALFRQLRPDCSRAIWSVSLSLPPTDGRQTPEKWAEITHSFFKKMGIEQEKYAWAAHRHTHKNDHVHLRFCRVAGDGGLWNQEYSAKKAIKACQELEVEFDLSKHDRTPSPKTRPSRAETQISARKGQPMSREKIQEVVDKIIKDHLSGLSFKAFKDLLEAEKIEVQPYAPGGVLKGVSYSFDNFKWPGSKIGREYSAGLTDRGVWYIEEVVTQIRPIQNPDRYHDQPRQQRIQAVPQSINSTNQFPQSPLARKLAEVSVAVDQTLLPAANTIFLQTLHGLIQVGLFSAIAAANLASKIWHFIQHILSYFGLGTKQPLQNYEHPAKPELTYTPVKNLALDKNELAEQDAMAADAVKNVLKAVKNNRPNDLPEDVPGRTELISAMADQAEKVEPLDALFNGHEVAPKPKIQAEPAQPDTLSLLSSAKAEFEKLQEKWNRAREVESPQVLTARQRAIAAQERLDLAAARYQREKAEKPKMLQFLVPKLEVVVKDELAAASAAQENLEQAQKKFPSQAPPQLTVDMMSAREKLHGAAGQHHAAMLKDVEQQDDLEVKKIALRQAQIFESQLETFKRSMMINFIDDAINSADIAPKLIADAKAEAKRKRDLAAENNVYVPGEEEDDEAKSRPVPK